MAAHASNLKIVCFFLLWYVLNVMYNEFNMTVLRVLDLPWSLAALQLGLGLLYVVPKWVTGLGKVPRLSQANLKAIAPIAMVHGAGQCVTVRRSTRACACATQSPVTPEAREAQSPVAGCAAGARVRRRVARLYQRRQVARAALQHGLCRAPHEGRATLAGDPHDDYHYTTTTTTTTTTNTATTTTATTTSALPWQVNACLLPVIVGVGIASATDLSFTWECFGYAMGSNLAYSLRGETRAET